MKVKALVAALVLTIAASASAQTYKETTTTDRTIVGEVVRFEPGKVIVIRSDSGEMSYTLTPSLTIPTGVAVGRRVTIYTAPNSTTVTRVTTSVTPEGETRIKEETRTTSDDKTKTKTTTKTTTVTGEVVRYEPGRTIVVRAPGREEVTYTLTPSIKVPADVAVGRSVTLYTEPGASGDIMISRVVTTSVTPEGNIKKTTEETRTHPSGAMTKTTTTSITGTVEAYDAGKTITITRPGGDRVTYVINEKSTIPADLAIGKTITLRAIPGASADEKVVQTVTYTKTKTKGGKTTTKTKTKTKTQ